MALRRLDFQASLLLAPLAYALHHLEEHVLGHFRAWRIKYLPDNNHLPTEAVICILMATTLSGLLLHATVRSRRSAQCCLLLLLATQVHNAIFHVGGTLIFRDWSPGTATALALYLPFNAFILSRALEERWISRTSGWVLFGLSGALFWSWEFLGPGVLVAGLVASWAWVIHGVWSESRGADPALVQGPGSGL